MKNLQRSLNCKVFLENFHIDEREELFKKYLCVKYFTDLESSLLALERLDRGSPDLWPDTSKFELSFK